MERPTDGEITVVYEEVTEAVAELGSGGKPSVTSAQASFNDGVKSALGWVLGQESQPEIEVVE